MKKFTRDDTEHGKEYYLASDVDALMAQPAPEETTEGRSMKFKKKPVVREMAKEAGLRDWTCSGKYGCLDRFAELVRADEREKVEDLLKEYDMVNSAFAKDFRARDKHD